MNRGAGVAAALLDLALPFSYDAVAVVASLILPISFVCLFVDDLRFRLDAVLHALAALHRHWLLLTRPHRRRLLPRRRQQQSGAEQQNAAAAASSGSGRHGSFVERGAAES